MLKVEVLGSFTYPLFQDVWQLLSGLVLVVQLLSLAKQPRDQLERLRNGSLSETVLLQELIQSLRLAVFSV